MKSFSTWSDSHPAAAGAAVDAASAAASAAARVFMSNVCLHTLPTCMSNGTCAVCHFGSSRAGDCSLLAFTEKVISDMGKK